MRRRRPDGDGALGEARAAILPPSASANATPRSPRNADARRGTPVTRRRSSPRGPGRGRGGQWEGKASPVRGVLPGRRGEGLRDPSRGSSDQPPPTPEAFVSVEGVPHDVKLDGFARRTGHRRRHVAFAFDPVGTAAWRRRPRGGEEKKIRRGRRGRRGDPARRGRGGGVTAGRGGTATRAGTRRRTRRRSRTRTGRLRGRTFAAARVPPPRRGASPVLLRVPRRRRSLRRLGPGARRDAPAPRRPRRRRHGHFPAPRRGRRDPTSPTQPPVRASPRSIPALRSTRRTMLPARVVEMSPGSFPPSPSSRAGGGRGLRGACLREGVRRPRVAALR